MTGLTLALAATLAADVVAAPLRVAPPAPRFRQTASADIPKGSVVW